MMGWCAVHDSKNASGKLATMSYLDYTSSILLELHTCMTPSWRIFQFLSYVSVGCCANVTSVMIYKLWVGHLSLLVDAYDLGQLQDSSLTSIVEDSNLASLMMFSGVISFSVCSASCCPFYYFSHHAFFTNE